MQAQFLSGVVSDALYDHYLDEEGVLTLDRADLSIDVSDSEAELDFNDCDAFIPWECVLGRDVSTQLGKDKSKLPQFARFLRPPASIQEEMEKMRRATMTMKSVKKRRSWMGAFQLAPRGLRTPMFGRFANPPSNIVAAVQAVRQAAASKRATMVAKACVKDWVRSCQLATDIREEIQTPAGDASLTNDGVMKMLTDQQIDLEATRELLKSLLGGFQQAFEAVQHSGVRAWAGRLALPETLGKPLALCPVEPALHEQETPRSGLAAAPDHVELCEPQVMESTREGCERCLRALEQFRVEAAIYEELKQREMEEEEGIQEVDRFLQEAQAEPPKITREPDAVQTPSDSEVQQLIDEELSKASLMVRKTGLPSTPLSRLMRSPHGTIAGSPAAAARRLRSQQSSPAISAMDMDLGSEAISSDMSFCAPKVSHTDLNRSSSASFISFNSKPKRASGALQSLMTSKSTIGRGLVAGDPLVWRVDPHTTSLGHSQSGARGISLWNQRVVLP